MVPSRSGTIVPRSETTPVAMLDWTTKRTIPRRSSPSGSDRRLREPPEERQRGPSDHERGHSLAEHEPDDRLGHAVVRAHRDPGQPEALRDHEEPAADVVAAGQHEHGARERLRDQRDRQQRRDQHRHEQVVAAEDRVGEGCEDQDHRGRDEAAERLQRQAASVQPAQAPPALGRLVAVAELDHRLLDGQVEQDLEEVRGDEDDGEEAEGVAAQLAGRCDRRQHSQRDASVGPGRRGRAAPQEALGHERPL